MALVAGHQQQDPLADVSRETRDRLDIYVQTLLHWNKRINLIGRATAEDVWQRHIVDSAQLSQLAPDACNWVDLGSGAGLPGVIVAVLRAGSGPDLKMTLVESDQRKCAFIADVSRKMGVTVTIRNSRIEAAATPSFDTISARALAPLTKLLAYAAPYRTENAICLFPKGAQAERELTEAAEDWHMAYDCHPSITDKASVILKMKAFERVV